MFYQYTKINIKKILEYKMDFFIGAMPHFVGQIANIAFFKIIIGGVARIQNCEINEVMLVFSFSTLIYGMHALLFGNFRSLKRYLFTGQFEIMRIRPIHIVRHLMIVDFRSESIEQIFLGSILLVYSATQLTVEINFRNILTALYFVACGAAVLGGLSLFSSSFLFFTQGAFTPINFISELREYTKYPIEIFGKGLQFVFTWLIPIGYVSYYPSIFFLRNQSNICLYSGLVALTSLLLGYVVFNIGLRFYEGVSA